MPRSSKFKLACKIQVGPQWTNIECSSFKPPHQLQGYTKNLLNMEYVVCKQLRTKIPVQSKNSSIVYSKQGEEDSKWTWEVLLLLFYYYLWVGLVRRDEDVIPALRATSNRYQFVPQLLFLNSLFGYLSMLILIKWIQGSKPDLYHVMIYMFLSPGEDLGENQLFWGQSYFQVPFTWLLAWFWLH